MEFVYQEEYVKGSRGVRLFTCRWVPSSSSPKALIFLCHAYGMECSVYMKECGIRLACAGYAMFGIDCEGHGRSSGSRCYIKKFENFVNDCDEFFKSVCEKLKPHPIVVNILMGVRGIIPKWKIVPTKDVIDSGFRDPIKREKIRNNKLIYQNKPRIKTAMELLRTSKDIESSLNETKRTSKWKWGSCHCGLKKPRTVSLAHGRTQRTSQWKWSGCFCGCKNPEQSAKLCCHIGGVQGYNALVHRC